MRRSVIALGDGPERMLVIAEANLHAAKQAADPWALSLACANLFQAHDVCGHADRAHQYATESLAQARLSANPLALANATGMLAQSLMARGELNDIEAILEDGINCADRIGYGSISSVMRMLAALGALLREEPEPATRWIREALAYAAVGNGGHSSTLIIAGAALASLRGDGELAAVLWAQHHQDNKDGQVADDSVTARLSETLTPRAQGSISTEAWNRAWARGLELDFPDAFRLVQTAFG
jgi:hypothetical protein